MGDAGEELMSVADVDESEPTVITDSEAQQFGRYQLRFEIATGGMASVYLASARGPAGFEKLVALKRIHPHLAKKPQFVEMFLDEARIASLIQHPNVCGVIDFGETEGTYYLAMDYLVGEPVSRLVRALARKKELVELERFPAIAARIIADACEGLHAAHEVKDQQGRSLNVVHRDVSPHNIFVTYDGGVRIVDFGVASADNRLHETTAGTVKGKFAYMAPEQVRGSSPDRRMDVWSLGVVLFELLTQKRLFRRKTEAETITAVQADPIPAPSELVANVPAALDAIARRALSRDPDERYQTAREMGRDLLRFLGTQSEPVGMSDLSEWMERAFPEGRGRKMQLVAIARQPEAVPKMLDDSGSTSGVPGISKVKRKEAEPAGSAVTTRKQIAAAVALVLTGVLAGVIAVRTMGTDPADESANLEPTSNEESEPEATEPEAAEPVPAPATPEVAVAEAAEPIPAPATPEVAVADDVPPPTMEAPLAAETPSSEEPTADVPPSMTTTMTTRPRMRPQPEATGEGQINLVTPGGWAIVRFRGRRIGQTPGQFTLPAGSHILELQPFGEGARRRVRVNVARDATRRVSVPVGG